MLEAPHYSAAGARHKAAFALPAGVFDGTVNEPVLHQAVRAFLGNQRQGTHQTKTRSFVSGGNQKPWRQKGTGRARQGSIRAPHWRGGGIVFGPHPRDYRIDLPRKVRQLARKSALNARAREGAVHVLERLDFPEPRTSRFAELLAKLELNGHKVLVLTAGPNPTAYLSGRNIPDVRVLNYADASAYDLLWANAVVVEEAALSGEIVVPPPPPAKAEPKARGGRRPAAAAKKPAGAPAAKKPAARKSASKPKKKGGR